MSLHTKNQMSPHFTTLLIRLREVHERYVRCVADLAEYEKAPYSGFDLTKWSALNDALLKELHNIIRELHTHSLAVYLQ